MSEEKTEAVMKLAAHVRPRPRSSMSAAEVIALLLSLLWIAMITLFFVFARSNEDAPEFDTLRFVMTIMAVFMPVAIIWVAAAAARSARIMREESTRLQAAIDGMRQTYLQQQHGGGPGMKTSVEKKLDDIAAAQRKAETAIATFASIRMPGTPHPQIAGPAPSVTTTGEGQASLELGTPAETLAAPLSTEDFIRALNFPENAEDHEGFRSLRRALQDRRTAQLVQAAQDVLTLLSQDGIYMDDLRPERAKPDLWRRFARGERGRAISGLGGIRDRSSLALSAGRMRSDTIFRDATHHFLRKFDQMLSEFETTANDADIVELSDTRSARAFMLLGRVAGTFD